MIVLDVPAVPRHRCPENERSVWRAYIRDARSHAYPGRTFRPPERTRVVIERYARRLLHDDDRLCETNKFVLEALKANALILDDNSRHCQWELKQFITAREPHLVITIEAAQ